MATWRAYENDVQGEGFFSAGWAPLRTRRFF
jgi:hypothetical protein